MSKKLISVKLFKNLDFLEIIENFRKIFILGIFFRRSGL